MGRPSTYTQETADAICARLAEGESLRSVCESDDMPSRPTVLRWVEGFPAFRDQYATSRDIGYKLMADEILEIADEGKRDTYIDANGDERTNMDVIARSRLRVDTRKWILSKVLPKLYGDKTILAGDPDNPVRVESVTRRIIDTAGD